LSKRDLHTDAYFAIVLERLFFELSQRNVRSVFVLDNELRDDRFKVLTELFSIAGFTVIDPYEIRPNFYGEGYTPCPARPYELVEKDLSKSIHNCKNILYLEKDDSVNFIDSVLMFTRSIPKEYVCSLEIKRRAMIVRQIGMKIQYGSQ
jgi:hypothetical protein